jgi:hypothetical protein
VFTYTDRGKSPGIAVGACFGGTLTNNNSNARVASLSCYELMSRSADHNECRSLSHVRSDMAAYDDVISMRGPLPPAPSRPRAPPLGPTAGPPSGLESGPRCATP